jgi:hypothetical protein
VISRNILFSALLVISAHGCNTEEGGVIPTLGTETNPVCPAAGASCTGDTMCGETGCQPAFDRNYQVRIAWVHTPGKRDGECPDDKSCAFPGLTVYFSERDAPILDPPDGPWMAEIFVTKGSSLIVELRHMDCLIELTPDRLRDGKVGCSGPSMSVMLSLAPSS